MTQSLAAEGGLTVRFLIQDLMLCLVTINVACMVCCKVPEKVAAVHILKEAAKSRTTEEVHLFFDAFSNSPNQEE